MAVIRPFRAVRPVPDAAPRVAAVPYDVVDTEEARALAAGNALSFLHVSRAEIDLPAGTDPHDDQVYRTAADRYRALKRTRRSCRRRNRRSISITSTIRAMVRRAWPPAIRSPST